MTAPVRFHQKVAIVTGAAQGIGRRVTERLQAEGAWVLAVDRSELVRELASDTVLTLEVDLETVEGAQAAAQARSACGQPSGRPS